MEIPQRKEVMNTNADEIYTLAVLVFMATLVVMWLWLVITEHYYWKGFRNGKRLAENTVKTGERVS